MIFKRKKRVGPPNIEGIEQTAEYYSNKYSAPYSVENYEPVFNYAVDWIQRPVGKKLRILDIGCGIGELPRRLRERGFRAERYFGFDVSDKGIEIARKNNREWSDRFKVYDCYHLNELDFDYDLAVAIEVLEHIQDLDVIPLLKKGTRFIGSVPNFWASDNAHLRVYPSRFFIWKRYRKLLKFKRWKQYRFNKYRFIHLFYAVKK